MENTQAAFDFIVATLKGCEVKDLGLMIKATVPTPKFHGLLEAIRFIEPHGIAMEMECTLPGKPSAVMFSLGNDGEDARLLAAVDPTFCEISSGRAYKTSKER